MRKEGRKRNNRMHDRLEKKNKKRWISQCHAALLWFWCLSAICRVLLLRVCIWTGCICIYEIYVGDSVQNSSASQCTFSINSCSWQAVEVAFTASLWALLALVTCCTFLQVQYAAEGFLEKNRDTLPANIHGLFINSITPLLSVLFTGKSLRYDKASHMIQDPPWQELRVGMRLMCCGCFTAGNSRKTGKAAAWIGAAGAAWGCWQLSQLFVPLQKAKQVVSSRELCTAQMSSFRSDSPSSPGPVWDCFHWPFPYALFLSRSEAGQGHSFWLFTLKIECCKATSNECRDHHFQIHFVFRGQLVKKLWGRAFFFPTSTLLVSLLMKPQSLQGFYESRHLKKSKVDYSLEFIWLKTVLLVQNYIFFVLYSPCHFLGLKSNWWIWFLFSAVFSSSSAQEYLSSLPLTQDYWRCLV